MNEDFVEEYFASKLSLKKLGKIMGLPGDLLGRFIFIWVLPNWTGEARTKTFDWLKEVQDCNNFGPVYMLRGDPEIVNNVMEKLVIAGVEQVFQEDAVASIEAYDKLRPRAEPLRKDDLIESTMPVTGKDGKTDFVFGFLL